MEVTTSSNAIEEEEEDLQLEVYEDKEYDIEEVKYWNFVAKKRAPKPDIIRTLVYKVPEQIKSTLLNQQQQQTTNIKSNSEITITRVLTNNNNASGGNKNRFNKLNLTALDMAHYNSNKTTQNHDYDQLDILKSNPIGSSYWSQQTSSKNENKRPSRRLPDEIQPLKSLQQQELNVKNQSSNKKRLNSTDRPTIIIETDEPAPIYSKASIKPKTTSSSSVNAKRGSDKYDLRKSKRKSINYNENQSDVYNFDNNENRDSRDDIIVLMDDYDDVKRSKSRKTGGDEIEEDEEDDVDFINKKIDEDDEDFDVRVERRKSKASTVKNKAVKSTSPIKQPVGRPRRQQKTKIKQKEGVLFKPPAKSTAEESTSSSGGILESVGGDTFPDDMRITRRLSLRRASLNRASINSNDILSKKESSDVEESDGNKVNNKKKSVRKSLRETLARKDSTTSNDRYPSRSNTPINTDTDETLSTNSSVKPIKKYRSYLSAVRDSERNLQVEKETNKKLLENYKSKHGNNLKQCLVTLERVKVPNKDNSSGVEEAKKEEEEGVTKNDVEMDEAIILVEEKNDVEMVVVVEEEKKEVVMEEEKKELFAVEEEDVGKLEEKKETNVTVEVKVNKEAKKRKEIKKKVESSKNVEIDEIEKVPTPKSDESESTESTNEKKRRSQRLTKNKKLN